ncbi:hypothetical protein Ade02nite_79610 [Paractinoplanes deccanensis]|uniref:Uncharacterized protein n=1 Tax=Paractinoplanes deccanensis TaxID=113561 RepID=A0ABQ3YHQ7_9ACTN|nr:hypothetical protein Ade02nite_79610 [Actinoplanes deccanensis]
MTLVINFVAGQTVWVVGPGRHGPTVLREPAVLEAGVLHVSVHFVQRSPVRLLRVLSAGLGMSRSEVRRLVADGSLSSARRLTGKSAGDFSFTLRRGLPAPYRPPAVERPAAGRVTGDRSGGTRPRRGPGRRSPWGRRSR